MDDVPALLGIPSAHHFVQPCKAGVACMFSLCCAALLRHLSCTTLCHAVVLGQQGIRNLAGNAGKRLWMSEYANGDFDYADIRSGLTLSTQVC